MKHENESSAYIWKLEVIALATLSRVTTLSEALLSVSGVSLYKIFQQINDIHLKKISTKSFNKTRNQGYNLRPRYCNKDIKKQTFSFRVVYL